MKICIRLHKTSDRDLIVLTNHYDIRKITRLAIMSYAYGKPVSFYSNKQIDLSKERISEHKYTISISDPIAQKLIEKVDKGCLGYFCKSVLRNSLNGIALEAFYKSPRTISLQGKKKVKGEVILLDDYELAPIKPNNNIVATEPEDVFYLAFNSVK